VASIAPAQRRIVVSIIYRIDPARAEPFIELMQESRRSRLALGALGWELLQDVNEPGLFIEQIIDESWTEHLRRFYRITEADVALRERRLEFHIGDGPPEVKRHVVVA
jgi:quinol monooxygenase YgiN